MQMMEHIFKDYKMQYGVHLFNMGLQQMFLKMHLKHSEFQIQKQYRKFLILILLVRSMMNVVEQLHKQRLTIFHLDTQVQI